MSGKTNRNNNRRFLPTNNRLDYLYHGSLYHGRIRMDTAIHWISGKCLKRALCLCTYIGVHSLTNCYLVVLYVIRACLLNLACEMFFYKVIWQKRNCMNAQGLYYRIYLEYLPLIKRYAQTLLLCNLQGKKARRTLGGQTIFLVFAVNQRRDTFILGFWGGRDITNEKEHANCWNYIDIGWLKKWMMTTFNHSGDCFGYHFLGCWRPSYYNTKKLITSSVHRQNKLTS